MVKKIEIPDNLISTDTELIPTSSLTFRELHFLMTCSNRDGELTREISSIEDLSPESLKNLKKAVRSRKIADFKSKIKVFK